MRLHRHYTKDNVITRKMYQSQVLEPTRIRLGEEELKRYPNIFGCEFQLEFGYN